MKLIIEDDEGRRTIVPFLGEALSIGRADDNQVLLGEKNVSRKHGRIVRTSGRFVVEDLSSFTGIRVNGEKVVGKRQIKEGDLIQISEFDLQLQAGPDDLPKGENGAAHALLADEDNEPTAVSGKSAAEEPPPRQEDTAVIKREAVAPVLALAAAEPIDIAEAERPRLIATNGLLRGEEYPLARSPASLGRALENDVCIDNAQVSRSHCRLAFVTGGWKVIDAESRHGVKVNGEPYAASPLHHGDILEVGPVRLIFALPGKAIELPPEPTEATIETPPVALAPAAAVSAPRAMAAPAREPETGDAPAPAQGKSATRILAVAAGAIAIAIAAVLIISHQKSSASDAPDAIEASLQRANAAQVAHHYREAIRALQTATAEGATAEQTRQLPTLEPEARAEDQYEQLVQAIARGDFDAARALLDLLAAVPTWFGGRALEHSQEVKAGYVKLHVDRANADRGRDDAACVTEANLALAANPQSEAARALANECSAPTAAAKSMRSTAPSRAPAARSAELEATRRAPESAVHPGMVIASASPTTPAARPAAAARSSELAPPPPVGGDADARRLLRQGNLEATAGDYNAAIADFERALQFNPSGPVAGSLYRSLGATYSRSGNADQGARYYRLYLPYCDNPTEKAFLQKTLDEYDAARARSAQ